MKKLAIAFAVVVVLLGILIFVPAKTPGVMASFTVASATDFKYDSGITGTITLGPTCPVEQASPDPACVPKPYPTRIMVYQKNSVTIAAMAAPDETGFYKIVLSPGDYTILPQGGDLFPRCAPMEVIVSAGKFTTLDLQCDTGIR